MRHPIGKISLAAALLALVAAVPVEAIEIVNHTDDTSTFFTSVTGSVGFFSRTHTLIDIPGTPWVNSSVIVETNGPAGGADSLSVTWTSQHIQGPHAGDIDPNGAATLTFTYTPTAAGSFGSLLSDNLPDTRVEIPHARVNDQPHFDRFVLNLSHVTVDETLLGGFDIVSYEIHYFVRHCDIPDNPRFICFEQPPTREDLLVTFIDDGGVAEVPQPAALVLSLSGMAVLLALAPRRRSARRTA